MTCDYSIIIPAYNEAELLPATLSALRKAMDEITTLTGEIIVTDNASTDETAMVARTAGAFVVDEPYRQIAKARNTGARHSSGRFLIFIDADTIISASLLKKTLELLGAGDCCGGGACLRFDRPTHLGVTGMLAFWNAISRAMKWMAGCYVFCLRGAFIECGGFDENYYAAEEILLSRKLRQWGRKKSMTVRIIKEFRPITSARKFTWYRFAHLLKSMLTMVLFPWRLRSRESCGFWYVRPHE
jgi:glycosyltransferase involved in cell wall biosynthesis